MFAWRNVETGPGGWEASAAFGSPPGFKSFRAAPSQTATRSSILTKD